MKKTENENAGSSNTTSVLLPLLTGGLGFVLGQKNASDNTGTSPSAPVKHNVYVSSFIYKALSSGLLIKEEIAKLHLMCYYLFPLMETDRWFAESSAAQNDMKLKKVKQTLNLFQTSVMGYPYIENTTGLHIKYDVSTKALDSNVCLVRNIALDYANAWLVNNDALNEFIAEITLYLPTRNSLRNDFKLAQLHTIFEDYLQQYLDIGVDASKYSDIVNGMFAKAIFDIAQPNTFSAAYLKTVERVAMIGKLDGYGAYVLVKRKDDYPLFKHQLNFITNNLNIET